ncbi:MAG: manganese/iron transport system ATP-binding protein [Solirubrobacterales bacterium]|jgi:zinc transport system ATP-binding protein|nr:manganese/iron transport system ATP-binding protein [Solirubrobacterales bacterium]
MRVVELNDVSFAYEGGPPVLSGVDMSIDRGEFVAIAGPNGGGKTTLVRLIVGLERPGAGEVLLGGSPDQPRRLPIGYLPQRADARLDAPITVTELVLAGRVPVRGVLAPLRAADRRAAAEAIERVGLTELRDRPITRLSGGQRQRAFIAKALAGEPELLVLDEPTAGVDADAQEALAALLDGLRRDLGVTVLYVSHEFGAIEPYVERLLLIRGGIVFDGKPSELPSSWHDPSHVHG